MSFVLPVLWRVLVRQRVATRRLQPEQMAHKIIVTAADHVAICPDIHHSYLCLNLRLFKISFLKMKDL